MTQVESEIERSVSRDLMGTKPQIRTPVPGETVADTGRGAIVGERASRDDRPREGSHRTQARRGVMDRRLTVSLERVAP